MRHKLLSTTAALAFAMAAAYGPAHAQVSGGADASAGASVGGVSAGADAGVGASVGDGGVSADADAGVGASVGDGGVSADADVGLGATSPVTGQALASVDASLMIGAPIVSADQVIIGTVTDIFTDANGEVTITVDLAGELGVNLGSTRISAEHATFVNQQIQLGMTQANLVAALETQLGAGADAAADANVGAAVGVGVGDGDVAAEDDAGVTRTGPVGTAALAAPSPGAAGVDGIGSLAGLSEADLRSTVGGLGTADVAKLKTACAEVLSNPAAYSADTRAVCEVIASI